MSLLAQLYAVLAGPPRLRPSTPWGPVSAPIAAAAILALAFSVAGTVGAKLGGAVPGSGADVPLAERPAQAIVGMLLAFELSVCALLWLIVTLRGGQLADVLCYREPAPPWPAMLLIVLVFLLLSGIFDVVVWVVFRHDILADARPIAAWLKTDVWWQTTLMALFGAPLSEELLFRGFLLPALARGRWGANGAIAITTALWTALHLGYSPFGLASVFLTGVMLGWLLWRTGNVWVCFFCHFGNNLVSLLIMQRFAG